MSKDMRATKIKGWFEFYRISCPICGHVGGCMQHKDGEMVACIRTSSDRPFSKNSALPSYLHFLNGDKKRRKIKSQEVKARSEKKLAAGQLHEVYTVMLDKLALTDDHFGHLTSAKRRLNDDQIERRQYRSFPNKPWNIVKEIQEEVNVPLKGVPGFFKANGKYGAFWSIAGRDGILIPYRNEKKQIVGFQYRIDNPPNVAHVKEHKQGLRAVVKEQPNLVQILYDGEIILEQEMDLKQTITVFQEDNFLGWVTLKKGNRYYWLSSANREKGTSSGDPAPVHVSIPSKQLEEWKEGETLKRKKIWLSEGALKCDIAADLLQELLEPEEMQMYGNTFIALPGINAWQLVLPVLEAMGVEEVNMCFDADVVSNVHVRKHLMYCIKTLQQKKYHVNMVIWNEEDGVGIDDLLLQHKIPQFKSLF
ncbi:DUF3854 domain-containing protein [Gracilibacillus sp. YIM 98692]|uniref:DUF3854 domain-containing protein n=1 Tax=Gracilibacillus sp. YIM 98692 TaxID=2663532 RepID=UPI0013D43E7C|nr:DUF3854 domain-containing protein [Gracilibacillus sp. YIM 98692]